MNKTKQIPGDNFQRIDDTSIFWICEDHQSNRQFIQMEDAG